MGRADATGQRAHQTRWRKTAGDGVVVPLSDTSRDEQPGELCRQRVVRNGHATCGPMGRRGWRRAGSDSWNVLKARTFIRGCWSSGSCPARKGSPAPAGRGRYGHQVTQQPWGRYRRCLVLALTLGLSRRVRRRHQKKKFLQCFGLPSTAASCGSWIRASGNPEVVFS